MAQDQLGYDRMSQEALRSVIPMALRKVIEGGLPNPHHLYITFKTESPGVDLDPELIERYPDEMTVVLEHQFWDLAVDDDAFEVTLKFNGIPKYLRVPFAAIVQYHDAGVGFGLRFEPAQTPGGEVEPKDDAPAAPADPDAGGEVVSLDAFRKKTD